MGEKEGRAFRNNYKGHMDKTKGGLGSGERGGDGQGGEWRGKMQTTVLEQK